MFKDPLLAHLKQKELLIGGGIALVIVALFVVVPYLKDVHVTFPPSQPPVSEPQPIRQPEVPMPTFTSCDQLETKLSAYSNSARSSGYDDSVALKLPQAGGGPISTTSESSVPDYSKTNVQVEGVDEADMVKSDGRYIYVLTNNKVSIIRAGEPM